MNKSSRLFYFLSMLLSIALFVSCSSNKEEEAKEIVEQSSTSGVSLDSPEAVLFQKGLDLYQSKLYSLATEYFEALRTGYPLGPFCEYADMKVADCRFQQREYESAAQGYEDFVKNRPASGGVPYALYMAGRSHQLANRGTGRDPAPLENAAKFYQRLLAEYPDSFYTLAAAEHQKEVMEALAAHEERIIAFYRKKDKTSAVEARSSLVNSQLNPKVETAKKAAETEEKKEEEKQEVEKKSTESAKALPAPAAVAMPKVGTYNVPAVKGGEAAQKDLSKLKVGEVRCETPSGAKARVFIFLSRPISDASFESRYTNLKAENGKITVKLPQGSTSTFSRDCFGSNDLSVADDGTIELNTNASGHLMLLQHPDRLLIVLD